MHVGRADFARPATGPKMEKINLVLETGLGIEKTPTLASLSLSTAPV